MYSYDDLVICHIYYNTTTTLLHLYYTDTLCKLLSDLVGESVHVDEL